MCKPLYHLTILNCIETEMDQLLENRMKELSGNDMEVWVFDTKRNPQVLKGRLEQEQAARRKEESMMDLELDFLAPYLERMLKFLHYFLSDFRGTLFK